MPFFAAPRKPEVSMEKVKKEIEIEKVCAFCEYAAPAPADSQILIAIKLMYPTTVKCESGFSIMKYVKTEHRTRLKQQSLDSIMRIKYEKDIEIKKAIFYVMKNKNFYMEELEN